MNITNKIKIICEESYAETIWCKQLMNGLTKELKKRRFAYEQQYYAKNIKEEDCICLLGMSNEWIGSNVRICNESGCVPIVLSNQSKCYAKGQYHLICPDIQSSIAVLKNSFAETGRSKVALYGANYSGDIDKDRTEIFAQLVSEPSDVYVNTGNLETCFRSFQTKAGLYDAVVCVNGYAAISLVKKLEKENSILLDRIVIISCEEILKNSKYNQWISVIDLNLESYGSAVMAVWELSDMKNDISEITIRMRVNVCEIPEKDGMNRESELENIAFYEDPEIIHMAKIEQLLQNADDMDHHILAMLLGGAKYSEIADSCYMTEGNVKYRVKKYMSTCNCKTKKELLELLQEYLQ